MGGTVPRDLLREADGEDAGTTSVLLSASHRPCLSLSILAYPCQLAEVLLSASHPVVLAYPCLVSTSRGAQSTSLPTTLDYPCLLLVNQHLKP